MKTATWFLAFLLILTILASTTIVQTDIRINYHYVKQLFSFKEVYNISKLPFIGRSLAALYNATLFVAPLSNALYDVGNYKPGYDPLNDYAVGLKDIIASYNVLTNNSLSIEGIVSKTCGSITDSNVYNDTIRGFVVQNITYERCQLILVNKGYLNFTYGDGKVVEVYPLNRSDIVELAKDIWTVVYHHLEVGDAIAIFNLSRINVTMIFTGIGAETAIVSYEFSYEVKNGTLVPVNRTFIKLINPYYKFYILFNGIRYAYPFKVGIEDVNGKPMVKFIEFFIPPINYDCPSDLTIREYEECLVRQADNYTFTVNNTYLNMIVNAFRKAIGDENISLKDIIIADIYYLPTRDYKYLTPVIELYRNSTEGLHEIIYMRLYKTGPIVESIAVVSGTPSPSDPLPFIQEDITRARAIEEEHTEGMKKLMTIGILIGIALGVSLIIIEVFIIVKHRHRKS